jgi:UDP:flavonoid glycosyltransferase YjiC (YdhE family)
MKFVVVAYGSRGDIEPCVAAGRELRRRGHEVRIAVPPNMLGYLASAGLAGVAYGPDSREGMETASNLLGNLGPMMENPLNAVSEIIEHVTQVKMEKGATLTPLANGADLVLAGFNEQGLATNVAEYYGIPVVALHPFPEQIWSSGQLFSLTSKVAEDAQRRALGLPEGTEPSPRPLEIQTYDELCVPEQAAEWAAGEGRRPFVGALTLELPTDADDEIMSWIAAGPPPVYFGFGSTPLAASADTIAVISSACARIGQRALICMGPNDFAGIPNTDHVKVVHEVNHAAVFPACGAVVHHGGAGTTAASLRAGTPTLVLWNGLDQPTWAAVVERLEVGFGRNFSEATLDSLTANLRLILTPRYATQAREVAAQMTNASESLASATNLLEHAARQGREG